ncbi:hypothetical protein AEM42_12925 [Betaproteobacteria bacterium UKL13-2]|jgi:hypothetical protein|nr:hypothetical protein AEM42_12925 [Betaproteobacteria bacterium UKL13-2]HCG54345.1 hypothetical protein [Betaproteobacteria bacterium]
MNTENLVDQYFSWLKSKTAWREINGWTEITTPYLDRHNDYIQIYLRQNGDEWELTDDGETLTDLIQSGCELDTPRRKALLQTTLNGFGMHLANGAITVKTKQDSFALRKHNLIQAILAVNDLFYLARASVESFFFEDVALWMDDSDIRYTQRVKFSGRTGYDHLFDFVVPKSKKEPERILRVVNNPAKDQANAAILSWVDTKEARPSNSVAYAVLNDKERIIPDGVVEALKNYDITPLPWSQRDEFRERLAA